MADAPTRRTVNITLETLTGEFSYDPALIRVVRNQEVGFRLFVKEGVDSPATEAPSSTEVTVFFKGVTPSNKTRYEARREGPIRVRADASPGIYPYAVVITLPNRPPYLDVACPEMIID